MLLKDAKSLPETHRNSLLLLCYSLVFPEQFWSRQEPRSHQGQVEQKMGNLACMPARGLSGLGRGRELRSREKALAHMPMQKDTRH